MKYYFNYSHTRSYTGFVYGAGRRKQGNREGEARLCLRRIQMVDLNWTLHMHSKAADLLLPRLRKKRMQQRLSKVQFFCCYHVVSFHISPLCNEVCSLETQFGPVTKQKIFSLPHSSEILLSEQLRASFFYLLSRSLSNMQRHSREAVSGNTSSLGFHEAF